MQIIPKKLWEGWSAEEIRILVLLSLFMQMVLICLSLFRKQKQSASKLLSLILWASYLGADSVATLALLNKETEVSDQSGSGDIIAFWGPVLLLHLGGPDSITSYSLEDNELWFLHFLGLMVHVVVAILAFLESLPSPHLQKAAIVVFTAGIVKYAERTLALRSASRELLIKSMLSPPDPESVRFRELRKSFHSAGLNAEIIRESPPIFLNQEARTRVISDVEVILQAHRFFQTLKLVSMDLLLSIHEWVTSQTFFVSRTAYQAFRVVEVELSFLHDVLHTKAVHVHSIIGRIMRALSLIMIVVALVLFHCTGKHDFNEADVIITYVLLVAALGLETISIVLIIFSDWTIVALLHGGDLNKPLITRIKIHIGTSRLARVIVAVRRCFLSLDNRKWSNSMGQYSPIPVHRLPGKSNKLKRICDGVLRFFRLKQPWNSWWYVGRDGVGDELKKAPLSTMGDSTGYKRLRTSRGEWVLWETGYSDELGWSVETEFDHSIMLWHIATLLCYQNKKELLCYRNKEDDEDLLKKMVIDHRAISMKLSYYMMYLVVFQPSMVPSRRTNFQDTFAEADILFTGQAQEQGAIAKIEKRFRGQRQPKNKEEDSLKGKINNMFQKLFKFKPAQEGKSKSVLSEAWSLAQQIEEMEMSEEKRWKVVSAVWAEMLCYAARNCSPHAAHAKQLSQGGELLTHVWLLMAHLGISAQYAQGPEKLIVDM